MVKEFGGEAGEAGEDGGLVKRNPIGIYYGHRNDKNERHGRGRSELPNGDLFLGCYYRGQRHGLGIYRYKNGNGARYGGDWTFGEKKGWGTMYYPDGAQYTGNWDRNLRHGWGVYVYPNGDEYEGWWYYGTRNGRGIYRTKANGEKFVGDWRLGKRHGSGLIVRKDHRFVGNWFNDAPKGPGVYIFPELQCEQHGRYTHMICTPGGDDRWTLAGYQVRKIREAPPMDDPIEHERHHKEVVEATPEVEGEGVIGDLKSASTIAAQPPLSTDTRVFNYMLNLLQEEAMGDETKISVIPMWRAIQITGLITPIPDESVPPPPLPLTPQPPVEPEEEKAAEEAAEEAKAEENLDPILEARRLAATHALQATYFGHGVCQPDEVQVKLPLEVEPYSNFSMMSLSNMDEMRANVEAAGGQLEPFDIEAAMKENEARMKGQGMDVAERWRKCLGTDDPNCQLPEAPAPPGGLEEGGSRQQLMTQPPPGTEQSEVQGMSGYDGEEDESENLPSETEDEDELDDEEEEDEEVTQAYDDTNDY